MGEIPAGQTPKKIPLSSHPSPPTGANKSGKGPCKRRKNLFTILDFPPPFSKQRLAFVTCKSSISRLQGCRNREKSSLKAGGQQHCHVFFFFPRAACSAGCILHNRTKPQHGSFPSLRRTPISCQLSLGITGMQPHRRKRGFFFFFFFGGRGIREI